MHARTRVAAGWVWFDRNVLALGREMRLSYLPPLMVYVAAGISGLTGIVGTFFVKSYLGLSAEFLAALGFWAGIPWALKMPLGHLVDLLWKWKGVLVFLGAGKPTDQSALLTFVSFAPQLLRYTDTQVPGAGALPAAANVPPAAAASFQFATPTPTKSISVGFAVYVGTPVVRIVAVLTSATLKSVADIAIVPVACGAGSEGTEPAPAAPAASCTSR